MPRRGSTTFRVCEITNNPSKRFAGSDAGTGGGLRPRKVVLGKLRGFDLILKVRGEAV